MKSLDAYTNLPYDPNNWGAYDPLQNSAWVTQNSDSLRIQVSALNSRRTYVYSAGIPVSDVPSIDDAYLVSTSGRGPFITEIGDPFPSETIWTGVGGGGVIISSWNEQRGFLGYPSLYNFDAYELASKLRLP